MINLFKRSLKKGLRPMLLKGHSFAQSNPFIHRLSIKLVSCFPRIETRFRTVVANSRLVNCDSSVITNFSSDPYNLSADAVEIYKKLTVELEKE